MVTIIILKKVKVVYRLGKLRCETSEKNEEHLQQN